MPELKDPATPHYYGYDRRRNWEPDLPPPHNPTEQERAMADEKARLAKGIQDLQRDMQQQERALASAQPGASSKMRKALSEAEQKELAMRMQKTAEWMKQGYGDRNLGAETKMAEGLEQLSRDLQDVQKTVEAGEATGKPGQGDKNAEALSEVRNLRQMLERAQNQRGQQGQRQDYQPQNLSRDGQQGHNRAGNSKGSRADNNKVANRVDSSRAASTVRLAEQLMRWTDEAWGRHRRFEFVARASLIRVTGSCAGMWTIRWATCDCCMPIQMCCKQLLGRMR